MASGNPSPDPTTLGVSEVPSSLEIGQVIPPEITPPVLPSSDEYFEQLQKVLSGWQKEMDARIRQTTMDVNKWMDAYSKSSYQSVISGNLSLDPGLIPPGSRFSPRNYKPPATPGKGIPLEEYLANLRKT